MRLAEVDMTYIIQTDRLTLKSIDEAYAPQVLDFVSRNKSFLEEWEPKREQEYFTLETHKNILHDEFVKMQDGQLFKVWLFKNDEIIGSAALSNIVRGIFQSCHLGYKIDRDESNKGYMTEALRKVIGVAFEQLLLHRIEANIMPRNYASLKVVEKLGFYNEGLAKKYLKINGVWEDHIHMVLLNEKME